MPFLSWSYYGPQAWAYIFGRSKRTDLTFKAIFLLFIVLESAVTMEAVIIFSDAMILALVFSQYDRIDVFVSCGERRVGEVL